MPKSAHHKFVDNNQMVQLLGSPFLTMDFLQKQSDSSKVYERAKLPGALYKHRVIFTVDGLITFQAPNLENRLRMHFNLNYFQLWNYLLKQVMQQYFILKYVFKQILQIGAHHLFQKNHFIFFRVCSYSFFIHLHKFRKLNITIFL